MSHTINQAVAASCLIAVSGALVFFTPPAHAVVVTFQQGVNGYIDASDTSLVKATPTTDYSSSNQVQLGLPGTSNESHALLSFNNIFGNGPGQVPYGATINSASIGVSNVSITSPATGSVHRMTISWTQLIATWDSMNDGINNNPLGEYEPTSSYAGPLAGSAWDVTSIVQDWSNATPNFGVAVLPIAGQLGFQSSEAENATSRPLLTIDYTPVPEPTSLALLTALSLAIVRRRRHQAIA